MKRKKRAILLEDSESIRSLVESIFKNKGYEVIAYENPKICPLQSSHECHCSDNECCADIILTDVDMPHVSGLDFIESQLAKGCKVKNIAIMSGALTGSNLKRAIDLGLTVFDKPFSISDLEKWLDKCTEQIDTNSSLSDWFRKEEGT